MATTPSHDSHVADLALARVLTLPARARGIVVIAHVGGGDPGEHAVADVLLRARLGTLMVDLLTPREEAEDRPATRPPLDVALLADRVVAAIDWLDADAAAGELPPRIVALPVGCFAEGDEAPAALLAAARRPRRVAAVVSRGGRPDLAGEALARVTAPTLLIVADPPVAEPAVREDVAALARDWFTRHLAGDERARGSA